MSSPVLGVRVGGPELARNFQAFKKAKVSEYHVSPAPEGAEAEKPQSVISGRALTIEQIQRDKLSKIAAANWASASSSSAPKFNADLVVQIYKDELTVTAEHGNKPVPLQRLMVLEISQYLEKYLWPHFDAETATFEHVFSIILLTNEKFRENVPAWSCFHSREDVFPPFFQRVLTLKDSRTLSVAEKINYILFMINCFQSLGDEMVRPRALQLVNLQLWHALSEGRREVELQSNPDLKASWQKLLNRQAKAAKKGDQGVPPSERVEVRTMPRLLEEFLATLEEVVDKEGEAADAGRVLYCERFMEFLIDLLSQLPTRRFTHALVSDKCVVVKCRMSELYDAREGHLFSQLVDLLRFYEGFEMDDHKGTQLSDDQVQAEHCERLQALQRLAFLKFKPKLEQLALSNVGAVEKRAELKKHLDRLSEEELRELVTRDLNLVAPDDPWVSRPSFLKEVVVSAFEKRRSQREALNGLPLYPNEEIMWDESLVPSVNYTGEGCLALPKLNLQFLTLSDYLLRNFNLFRLESTYEIREDVQDVLQRMKAKVGPDGETVFGGWARMASKLSRFEVKEVKAPHIGEVKPAAVLADVVINLANYNFQVRGEWDELKEHDVVFLLAIQPPPERYGEDTEAIEERKVSVAEKFGLQLVRGCEVVEVKDEGGTLMNDFTGRIKREEWKPPKGTVRTLTVALDPAQYQVDIETQARQGGKGPGYEGLNVLMRRKPKENNFKAILESIRDLMNEEATVPAWLHDLFLGYDDPAAAQWKNLPHTHHLQTIDFKDTFLDAKHLTDSFPDKQVRFVTADGAEDPHPSPPFKVTLPPVKGSKEEGEVVVAQSYVAPHPGPYPADQPQENTVRFTPVQVEAIVGGVQPGLTMVVGPPGTGKTDTAVQILHVLYHNCPEQRTLLITHSNQALNDLFEKIMQRDVPARYLLRLGMGEQELDSEQQFSRQGRVNSMLNRRLELLSQVERLAGTLQLPTNVAYTCETAAHFWLLQALSRWEKFNAACSKEAETETAVRDHFPFTTFFANAPNFSLRGISRAADMRIATGCFRHLRTMFKELEECRAFELLKTTADRSNYLMTRQAKIVAMTCTHAALKRREFLKLGLKYDNLVLEESAQILEIETFIPMLLQRPQDGLSRLKRCVLIGDHHQLPPVVKNLAFQKYSHMDQSLFTRFVRLGVPYVELNAQGRARPSMANLYNWRYRALGDLPAVEQQERFQRANAGFAYEYQLVDVPDWMGRGESEPVPWFYQNLGEAEYVVSCFQYMRLLGYPADQIAILTTYNGQKHLIRDVIQRRCADSPLFGRPSKVTTVDRFQGQQSNYVLLSLVRTRTVGHLRDVRRLVVAMSRARLGLYVFGRRALFEQCYELQPTFKQLLQRPDKLAVVMEETKGPMSSRAQGDTGNMALVGGVEDMANLVSTRYGEWVAAEQAAAARQQVAASGVAAMVAHAQSKGFGVPEGAAADGGAEEAAPNGTAAAGVAAMLAHAQRRGYGSGDKVLPGFVAGEAVELEGGGKEGSETGRKEAAAVGVAAILAHAEKQGYGGREGSDVVMGDAPKDVEDAVEGERIEEGSEVMNVDGG